MNQRGFTMVEILVAMLLVSGIGYTVMYITLQGQLGAKSSQQAGDLNKLERDISLVTGDWKTCRPVFAGNPYGLTGTHEVALSLPGHSTPLKAGVVWSGWHFNTVHLQHDRTIEPDHHFAKLVIEAQKIMRTPGSQTSRREALLRVETTGDSQVVGCGLPPPPTPPSPSPTPSAT